jgi:hypothetical protein
MRKRKHKEHKEKQRSTKILYISSRSFMLLAVEDKKGGAREPFPGKR